MVFVTFVIPVRHPENASDWNALKERLAQTVASIAGQERPEWRGIIVANTGSVLPPLPPQFSVAWVDFPPNGQHDIQAVDKEVAYDAFRADKGRRVLKGMLSAEETRFFMIVDDDDFVCARITGHAASHPDANGWTIEEGYIWSEGSRVLFQYDDFKQYCGTSLIIQASLYELPETFEAASDDYIKSMLGSHVRIGGILEARGYPLQPLPFRGAIYRVGHAGAHSKSKSLFRTYFLNRRILARPRALLRNLGRLRVIDRSMRRDFFGG